MGCSGSAWRAGMMRLDKDIRRAMDARLSGLTACEERRADIRRRIAREGEKPMKRKMTAGRGRRDGRDPAGIL